MMLTVTISLRRLRMELGRVRYHRERGDLHLNAAPRLSITYAYGGV
jgi:hypothetical protein